MKKIYIILFVILSLQILSVICFAQGSVNSNNALGEPGPETNDPYSDTVTDPASETVSDTVTDTAADTAKDTVTDEIGRAHV